MKKKILIIEDEFSDYKELRKSLQNNDFEVYPDMDNLDDYHNHFRKRLFEALNQDQELTKESYVNEILENVLPDAIICDMKLGSEDISSGEDIVKEFRRKLDRESRGNLYKSRMPIYIMTKYKIGSELIKDGILYFEKYFSSDFVIDQHKEKIFIETIKYKIREYENDSLFITIIEDTVAKDRHEILNKQNLFIKETFESLEFLIKSNHEETIRNLSTLFMLSYQGLSNEKRQEFIKKYERDIIYTIGETRYNSLKISKKEEFIQALNSLKEKGGIEKFVSTSIDLLNEAGILDFPGAKLLGIGLKGIIGVACS